MLTCNNCRTEFWCEWNPDWYVGRLTLVSLGQDALYRRYSVIAVVLGAAALAYGLVLQVYYAASDSRDMGPLFAVMLGGFCLYEVWAFFHGRETHIDRYFHEARPNNTFWRTVGLFGDLVLLAVSLWVLYDIR
jgi:hypothetical protein